MLHCHFDILETEHFRDKFKFAYKGLEVIVDVILGMNLLAAEYCLIDVSRKTFSIWSQQIELELHSEQCQAEDMEQMFVAC